MKIICDRCGNEKTSSGVLHIAEIYYKYYCVCGKKVMLHNSVIDQEPKFKVGSKVDFNDAVSIQDMTDAGFAPFLPRELRKRFTVREHYYHTGRKEICYGLEEVWGIFPESWLEPTRHIGKYAPLLQEILANKEMLKGKIIFFDVPRGSGKTLSAQEVVEKNKNVEVYSNKFNSEMVKGKKLDLLIIDDIPYTEELHQSIKDASYFNCQTIVVLGTNINIEMVAIPRSCTLTSDSNYFERIIDEKDYGDCILVAQSGSDTIITSYKTAEPRERVLDKIRRISDTTHSVQFFRHLEKIVDAYNKGYSIFLDEIGNLEDQDPIVRIEISHNID